MLFSLDDDTFEVARKSLFRFSIAICIFFWAKIDISKLNIFGIEFGIENSDFRKLASVFLAYMVIVFFLKARFRFINLKNNIEGEKSQILRSVPTDSYAEVYNLSNEGFIERVKRDYPDVELRNLQDTTLKLPLFYQVEILPVIIATLAAAYFLSVS